MNDPAHTRNPLVFLDPMDEAKDLLAEQPLLGEKIVAATQIDPAWVPEVLAEVVRFLCLSAQARERLSPPLRLDLAWHEFILFTRLYDAWCRGRLGRFIHHTPGGSASENRSQLRRTLKRYALVYGAPDPRFWGDHRYYSERTDCGACSSDSLPELSCTYKETSPSIPVN